MSDIGSQIFQDCAFHITIVTIFGPLNTGWACI